MVKKIILDKELIYKLIHQNCDVLVVKYNIKNRRAFYKTNFKEEYYPIEIERVINIA